MFKKLLKYDLKWMLSIWWIGAVSILALAIPTGFALRNLINVNFTQYGEIFNGLWIYIYYLLICLFPALGSVLIFARYYCNFFRDEGYLTFTLPVKRSTLLLSKAVSGTLVNMLSLSTILLAVCTVLLIAPSDKGSSMPLLFEIVKELFNTIFNNFSFWVVSDALLLLISFVLYVALSTLVTYLFITIGATVVKKYKLLVTIGLMYASSFVASMVMIPMFILTFIWISSAIELSSFYDSPLLVNVFVTCILLCIIAAISTAIVAIYSVITGTLERKLNLQ